MKNLNGYLKKTLLACSVLFFASLSFSTPQKVLASPNLLKTSSSYFEVNNNGDLYARYNFKLNNKTSTPSVITNFSFFIPFEKYDSLIISIGDTPYKYNQKSETGGLKITLELPNLIVPQNGSTEIIANIVMKAYVNTSGVNYYILIPPIPSFVTEDVKITFPSKFGKVIWGSVDYEVVKEEGSNITIGLKFPKDISNPAIAILIGEKIGYKIEISREITNSTDKPSIYKISIPREGDGQHVLYEKIKPTPFDIEFDSESNINISYLLNPEETINIEAEGYIYFDEKEHKLPLTFENYLTLDNYWQFPSSDEMKRLSVYLRNNSFPATIDQITDAKQRKEFVTSLYRYTLDRLNPLPLGSGEIKSEVRLGMGNISRILSDGANPDDYTDFLIAILREAGVPSRMVLGYITPLNSYQEDGFFHSWVEYWNIDENRWILLDPALEDYFPSRYLATNYDHIALVSRSKSSILPQISRFSPEEFRINPAYNSVTSFTTTETSFRLTKTSDKYIKGVLTVSNQGNRILQLQNLSILKEKDLIKAENLWTSYNIIPGESREFSVVFPKTNIDSDSRVISTFSDIEGNVFKKITKIEGGIQTSEINELKSILISFIIFMVLYSLIGYIIKKIKKNG